jgi:hypothetical protein
MINWLIDLFRKEKMRKINQIDRSKLKEIIKNSKKKNGKVIYLKSIQVYVIDEKYFLGNLEDLKKFIKKDLTNFKLYIAEQSDCDDFAIQLWSRFKKINPNFAFGFAISPTHAFNIFIDDKLKIWIIEPQTDKIFEYKNQSKYKLKMVLI